MAVLLEKLSVAATDLLMDRINGGASYITIDDEDLVNALRRLKQSKIPDSQIDQAKEVDLLKTMSMRMVFEKDYEDGIEMIKVTELAAEYTLLINPLKSNVVSEIVKEQDLVMDRLNELGFKCEVLSKKSITRKRKKMECQFKPRRQLSQRALNRIRNENIWQPDLIRNNQMVNTSLPAVIFA